MRRAHPDDDKGGKGDMSQPDVIPRRSRTSTPTPRYSRLLHWVRRTPVRSFVIYPLVVIAFELVRRRGALSVMPWATPLLLWGYLQYRLVGKFRSQNGGGGPGLDRPPQRLVDDGPYRYARNPMYLGHLIFMAGLALTFRSWLGLVILVVNAVWFDHRVRGDEKHLRALFGAAYDKYCRRVKRWIPGLV